jgi:hypothetical protein
MQPYYGLYAIVGFYKQLFYSKVKIDVLERKRYFSISDDYKSVTVTGFAYITYPPVSHSQTKVASKSDDRNATAQKYKKVSFTITYYKVGYAWLIKKQIIYTIPEDY